MAIHEILSAMEKDQTSPKKSAIKQQIYNDLFPKKPSKSDKRRLEILEGAIKAYAQISYKHLSFDDVANPAKTSRRLVQHYFPDKNELFDMAMKMIRGQYQTLVIEAISNAESPEERFAEYVRSAVMWPRVLPLHVRAWFLYYLVCAQEPKFRKTHEGLAKMGEERIAALVSDLNPARKISSMGLHFVAKTVQRLIAGALIEICSESTQADIEAVQAQVLRACQSAIKDAD